MADPELPDPRFSDDLRSTLRAGETVPPHVDRVMRRQIREHFAGRRRRRGPWRAIVPIGAAAAAVIVIGLWINRPRPQQPAPLARTGVQFDVADLDRNGQVDILDAFALARRLESGAEVEEALDLNRDGAVDRLDADAIAIRAVALDGRASG